MSSASIATADRARTALFDPRGGEQGFAETMTVLDGTRLLPGAIGQ